MGALRAIFFFFIFFSFFFFFLEKEMHSALLIKNVKNQTKQMTKHLEENTPSRQEKE